MLAEAQAAGGRFSPLSRAQDTGRVLTSCSSTSAGKSWFRICCLSCLREKWHIQKPGVPGTGSFTRESLARESIYLLGYYVIGRQFNVFLKQAFLQEHLFGNRESTSHVRSLQYPVYAKYPESSFEIGTPL